MSPISAREEGVILALGYTGMMQGEQARRGPSAWQDETGHISSSNSTLTILTVWLETHPKSISISSSSVRAEGLRLMLTRIREPGTAPLPPAAECLRDPLSLTHPRNSRC